MARNRLNQAGNAPVAQRIERRFPKPGAQVRLLAGALVSACEIPQRNGPEPVEAFSECDRSEHEGDGILWL